MYNKKTFTNVKKTVILLLIIISVFLYIRAFFMSGIWLNDTFLYEKDGIFSGADNYAEYTVKIARNKNGAKIDFYLNDELYCYEVKSSDFPYTEIYENGIKIFGGKVLDINGTYILTDDENDKSHDCKIVIGGTEPKKEDLLPSCVKLYSLSRGETEKRGNPIPAVGIIIAAVFLFLDIKFPMLFFYTRHSLDVYGGEPSDWYLLKQQISRIIFIVIIIICAVLTFTTH